MNEKGGTGERVFWVRSSVKKVPPSATGCFPKRAVRSDARVTSAHTPPVLPRTPGRAISFSHGRHRDPGGDSWPRARRSRASPRDRRARRPARGAPGGHTALRRKRPWRFPFDSCAHLSWRGRGGGPEPTFGRSGGDGIIRQVRHTSQGDPTRSEREGGREASGLRGALGDYFFLVAAW